MSKMNRITVAVTGHRDMVETEELRQEVNAFFDALLKEYDEVTLLSPMAEGADQFVANIFLEKQLSHQHLNLIVPMPFSKERYIKDFDDFSSIAFERLSKKAKEVFCVPGLEENAYENVGRYMLKSSDILLALWDGINNHKIGGTSDVVAYASTLKHQIVHLHCERKVQ